MPAARPGRSDGGLLATLDASARPKPANNALPISAYYRGCDLLLSQVRGQGCEQGAGGRACEAIVASRPRNAPPSPRPRCTAPPATRSSSTSCSCAMPGAAAAEQGYRPARAFACAVRGNRCSRPPRRCFACERLACNPRRAHAAARRPPSYSLVIETIPRHAQYVATAPQYLRYKEVRARWQRRVLQLHAAAPAPAARRRTAPAPDSCL